MRSSLRHGCSFHVMSRKELPWGWIILLLLGLMKTSDPKKLQELFEKY